MIQTILTCNRCPRLRTHCKKIAKTKKKSTLGDTYWGKPVPPFGEMRAPLMIIGLAPAAHGANRTGRMFTGDRSGEWLYKALYETGFSSQPESTHHKDSLKLIDCKITSAVKCAPPDNKPTSEELARCAPFLIKELRANTKAKIYLCLGKIALDAVSPWLSENFPGFKKPKFSHDAWTKLDESTYLVTSYHPSQQNTFTGRLTWPMWINVFQKAKRQLDTV